MQPSSVRIAVVGGRSARTSLTGQPGQQVQQIQQVQQVSQGQPAMRVITSGMTYQSATSTPAASTRAVGQAVALASAVVCPAGARTVVTQAAAPVPAATAAYPAATSAVPLSAPASAATIVRTTQAGNACVVQPVVRAQPQAVTMQYATSSTLTRPVTVSGPTFTQGAYEAKHHDDPQLQTLKELRRTSGLKNIPVGEGLSVFKAGAADGKLTRQQFVESYEAILKTHSIEVPPESVWNAVFDLFDRDDNDVVDMMELVCGISLLCAGTEDEKIQAVFKVFDENSDGFISMDEMFKFLASVFKVVLTPNVLGVMNSMGVAVESAEDLASVTALECFKTADLNHDGKLSVAEFKNWFYTPRNDPSSLFSPVRKLLQ